jgi:hypothetical protein
MKFPVIFVIASLSTALILLTLADDPGVTQPPAAGRSSAHAEMPGSSLVEKVRDGLKPTFRRL